MRLSKIILILFASLVCLSGLSVSSVNAQTSNSAQGLEISPTLVELNAARGKTYSIRLKLRNVTAADLVYNIAINDFNSSDETGSPRIMQDSSLPSTASIKSWVNIIPQLTLNTHESKEIDAQVTIPNDAEPGGHYGVIQFSGDAPDIDSTGVGLSASAGVLILIRVEGDIVEKASLESFYSANSNNQSSFFEESPITFVTRIKNEGNIHIKPSGNIEVRDMFGAIAANYMINDQEPRSNVLPDSIRRFEIILDKPWMFGLYTANLTLGYGTTGQAITSTINFWVIPYKLIIAGIIAIATLGYIFKRLIKSYNKRIIEKSKNENSNKNKSSDKA